MEQALPVTVFVDFEDVLTAFDKEAGARLGRHPSSSRVNRDMLLQALPFSFYENLSFPTSSQRLWALLSGLPKEKVRLVVYLGGGKGGEVNFQYKRKWVTNHLGPNTPVATCLSSGRKRLSILRECPFSVLLTAEPPPPAAAESGSGSLSVSFVRGRSKGRYGCKEKDKSPDKSAWQGDWERLGGVIIRLDMDLNVDTMHTAVATGTDTNTSTETGTKTMARTRTRAMTGIQREEAIIGQVECAIVQAAQARSIDIATVWVAGEEEELEEEEGEVVEEEQEEEGRGGEWDEEEVEEVGEIVLPLPPPLALDPASSSFTLPTPPFSSLSPSLSLSSAPSPISSSFLKYSSYCYCLLDLLERLHYLPCLPSLRDNSANDNDNSESDEDNEDMSKNLIVYDRWLYERMFPTVESLVWAVGRYGDKGRHKENDRSMGMYVEGDDRRGRGVWEEKTETETFIDREGEGDENECGFLELWVAEVLGSTSTPIPTPVNDIIFDRLVLLATTNYTLSIGTCTGTEAGVRTKIGTAKRGRADLGLGLGTTDAYLRLYSQSVHARRQRLQGKQIFATTQSQGQEQEQEGDWCDIFQSWEHLSAFVESSLWCARVQQACLAQKRALRHTPHTHAPLSSSSSSSSSGSVKFTTATATGNGNASGSSTDGAPKSEYPSTAELATTMWALVCEPAGGVAQLSAEDTNINTTNTTTCTTTTTPSLRPHWRDEYNCIATLLYSPRLHWHNIAIAWPSHTFHHQCSSSFIQATLWQFYPLYPILQGLMNIIQCLRRLCLHCKKQGKGHEELQQRTVVLAIEICVLILNEQKLGAHVSVSASLAVPVSVPIPVVVPIRGGTIQYAQSLLRAYKSAAYHHLYVLLTCYANPTHTTQGIIQNTYQKDRLAYSLLSTAVGPEGTLIICGSSQCPIDEYRLELEYKYSNAIVAHRKFHRTDSIHSAEESPTVLISEAPMQGFRPLERRLSGKYLLWKSSVKIDAPQQLSSQSPDILSSAVIDITSDLTSSRDRHSILHAQNVESSTIAIDTATARATSGNGNRVLFVVPKTGTDIHPPFGKGTGTGAATETGNKCTHTCPVGIRITCMDHVAAPGAVVLSENCTATSTIKEISRDGEVICSGGYALVGAEPILSSLSPYLLVEALGACHYLCRIAETEAESVAVKEGHRDGDREWQVQINVRDVWAGLFHNTYILGKLLPPQSSSSLSTDSAAGCGMWVVTHVQGVWRLLVLALFYNEVFTPSIPLSRPSSSSSSFPLPLPFTLPRSFLQYPLDMAQGQFNGAGSGVGIGTGAGGENNIKLPTAFYKRRKKTIIKRAKQLRCMSSMEVYTVVRMSIMDLTNRQKMYKKRHEEEEEGRGRGSSEKVYGAQWSLANPTELASLAKALGGKALAAVAVACLQRPERLLGGMPDLLFWRMDSEPVPASALVQEAGVDRCTGKRKRIDTSTSTDALSSSDSNLSPCPWITSKAFCVEIKSKTDKVSRSQQLWAQLLAHAGISMEIGRIVQEV